MFRNLLAAEWTKLWSLRSTLLVPPLTTLVLLGGAAHAARTHVRMIQTAERPDVQRTAIDPMSAPFVDDAYLLLMIIAGSLGALTVVGEYATGLARTTFAAVPARRSVIAAKATVVAAVMFAFGAVVATGSFLLTQAIYTQVGIGLSLSAPGALRAVLGSALLAAACALAGMAIGALVRNIAGSVVTTVCVLGLVPYYFTDETYRWVKEVGNAMPLNAWAGLVDNPAVTSVRIELYPVTVTQAWLVLGGWLLAGLLITMVTVHRRDV